MISLTENSKASERKQFILHLIKSCEKYDNLNNNEIIDAINKILVKDISMRTYYNYKKKLYCLT